MGCTLTHIFDNIENMDEKLIAAQALKIQGKRDTRKCDTYGFTTLMYAILNNRPDISQYFMSEISCKLIQPFEYNGIKIAANSTAAQLAVFLEREEIIKQILSFLSTHQCHEQKLQLAEANDDGLSLFHSFIIIKNEKIQKLLKDYNYTPSKLEYQNEKKPIVFFCIQNTCPFVLEYILTLCRTYIYKEPTKEILKRKTKQLYETMNGMLEDTKVNQELLAQCRNLIIDFMYDKLPNAMQALQQCTVPVQINSSSMEKIEEKEVDLNNFNLKSSTRRVDVVTTPCQNDIQSPLVQKQCDQDKILCNECEDCNLENDIEHQQNLNNLRTMLGVTPIQYSSEFPQSCLKTAEQPEMSQVSRVSTFQGQLHGLEEESI